MFKIYDLNMKELPFPEGVKPLDIFVSSVNKRRLTEEFEGRSGTLNYGYDYGERSVDLSLWLEAYDTIDYRLIRNELYAFFDTHDVFYIEETRVPSRVLKVTIDESYIPERINQTHSSVEISCRTLDSVFWESKYTTLELHDSGYSATAEKYGLVDNIDDEKAKYRFENGLETVDLTSNLFEPGNIHNSRGVNLDSAVDYARSKSPDVVVPGVRYTIDLNDYTGDVSYIRLHYFREDGVYVGNDNSMSVVDSNGKSTYTFTAQSERLRLVIYPKTDKKINVGDIGNSIQVKLTKPSSKSNFTVYNAGNVTIEPESMDLYIAISYATSNGNLTLKNLSTGDEFRLSKDITNRNIILDGMNVRDGTSNAFRYTNRRFITLAPGDNDFEISGGTFSEIRFRFKYLYK